MIKLKDTVIQLHFWVLLGDIDWLQMDGKQGYRFDEGRK